MTAPLRERIDRVFVRALEVDARIGYYAHEKSRTQPLVIEVAIDVAPADFDNDDFASTIDYGLIAKAAHGLCASHIDLVETFAERLAAACLAHPRALAVRVRIEKPQALQPAIAGVEIVRLAQR